MPFRSERQQKYLWKHEPKIAKKWAKEDNLTKMPSKKKRKKDKLDY